MCGYLSSQYLQSLLTINYKELSVIDQIDVGQITLELYSSDQARIINRRGGLMTKSFKHPICTTYGRAPMSNHIFFILAQYPIVMVKTY